MNRLVPTYLIKKLSVPSHNHCRANWKQPVALEAR